MPTNGVGTLEKTAEPSGWVESPEFRWGGIPNGINAQSVVGLFGSRLYGLSQTPREARLISVVTRVYHTGLERALTAGLVRLCRVTRGGVRPSPPALSL